MHEAERREALYQEARRELLQQVERDGIEALSEHERRTRIGRHVRSLCARWPELDGQMSRRLLAEALDAEVAEGDDARLDGAPSSGQANVTTLRRDDRQWVR